MRQAVKLSALGFSATCFCLAADAAVGLGTAQWLVDLCLTEAPGQMGDMEMAEATPGPFLAMSVAFASIGIGVLVTEDREAALGLTQPDPSEHAAILSAIVLVAATTGKMTEQDIANVFEIVTGSELEPDLAALAFQRFQAIDRDRLTTYAIAPSDNSLARRRIMAAALMVGCVANDPTPESTALIESLAFSTGATPEDVSAARQALQTWSEGDSGLRGSPLITLMRGKPLGLRPA